MSKTIRKILSFHNHFAEIKEVDETQAKWQKRPISPAKGKRLAPYIKDIGHCWKYERTGFNHDHANTGFGARTGINNANRSMKKGLRQRYKKQIKEQLQTLK